MNGDSRKSPSVSRFVSFRPESALPKRASGKLGFHRDGPKRGPLEPEHDICEWRIRSVTFTPLRSII
ncbi:hypothetical protein SBA3_3180016 [Candidatus Sulfopaludibacter sp. SbA3]|nr:hypothetical protein SBA3_3180016 [Candidatus Sulfopaludibacter sp. SbA3]